MQIISINVVLNILSNFMLLWRLLKKKTSEVTGPGHIFFQCDASCGSTRDKQTEPDPLLNVTGKNKHGSNSDILVCIDVKIIELHIRFTQ